MPTNPTRYTPEEVLQFLRASYQQQQQFDDAVFKGYDLTFETTIADWIDICNLAETDRLELYYQDTFRMSIESAQWHAVWENLETRTLSDLCHLISQKAEKEVILPIKLLGQSCRTAAVFRLLLRKLQQHGIDTTHIRPSSSLEPLVKQAGSAFLNEINLLNPVALPALTYQDNWMYTWGFRLMSIALIMIIGFAIFQSNGAIVGILLGLVAEAMIWFGAKQLPRQARFEGIETVGDLVRRIG